MKTASTWRRTLAIGSAEIFALLILHRVLLAVLAEHQVVSKVLAGGPHVPAPLMVTAIGFLVVRLLAVLALPGMVLSRLGMVVMDLFWPDGG